MPSGVSEIAVTEEGVIVGIEHLLCVGSHGGDISCSGVRCEKSISEMQKG